MLIHIHFALLGLAGRGLLASHQRLHGLEHLGGLHANFVAPACAYDIALHHMI